MLVGQTTQVMPVLSKGQETFLPLSSLKLLLLNSILSLSTDNRPVLGSSSL